MTFTQDPETPPEVTLARFASSVRDGDIPENVLHEGKRSLVNIFATAFTGCHEEAIGIMLRAAQPYEMPGNCTVIGRTERTGALLATWLNAASANIFDFDDTHEATIIHPAAPVFPAVFAHAELTGTTGRDLLRAFVLGCEVECRIGNALSPYHYARGWHITSTCGIFGATAAVGHLLNLDPARMVNAFSAATVQSSGLVEALGTSAKSVSMGGAARNGYLSALLAAEGSDGPAQPLTGPRGYLRVYGETMTPAPLTDDLGQVWESAKNTYKPYPVGVVLNPVIEAILDMRQADGLRLEQVKHVHLTGHPLLQQRTDRPDVTTGRETQVSAQHAITIALLRGRAGIDEFSDAAAQETFKIGRPEVRFTDAPERAVTSVVIEVELKDGGRILREIDPAAGSQDRPLSDAQLEDKFRTGADRAKFPGDTRKLLDALWAIDRAPDAGDVIRMAGA